MPSSPCPTAASARIPKPVSVEKVAADIGPGLAKAALAGKVDGKLVDTSLRHRPRRAARDRHRTSDPDGLEVIRHSTAHLLAQAVQAAVPGRAGHDRPGDRRRLLLRLRLQAAVHAGGSGGDRRADARARRRPTTRSRAACMPRDDAVEVLQGPGRALQGRDHRQHSGERGDQPVRAGRLGRPVPRPARAEHRQAARVQADEGRRRLLARRFRNEMLQRIYGTAWPDEKELKAYLTRLEEAEKRDHRKIGKEQDLFHFQEEAPGAVFWHPKGWTLFQALIALHAREAARSRLPGSERARRSWTRSCGSSPGTWRTSARTCSSRRRRTSAIYAIKPMNCPGHIQIFNQGLHSYRDLPLRFAEFGKVPSLRALGRAARPDARARLHAGRRPHLLHRGPDRSRRRVRGIAAAAVDLPRLRLRRRAGQVLGPPGQARRAATRSGTRPKQALQDGDARRGRRVHAEPGRGRLLRPEARVRAQGRHRPRLAVRHLAGRSRTCPAASARTTSTRTARSARPVMLHRAIFGSLERFIGILIEHHAGQLPDLAGAGAGRGHEHHRQPGRLCAKSDRNPEKSGASGRRQTCATRRSALRSASTRCSASRTCWSLAIAKQVQILWPCARAVAKTSERCRWTTIAAKLAEEVASRGRTVLEV